MEHRLTFLPENAESLELYRHMQATRKVMMMIEAIQKSNVDLGKSERCQEFTLDGKGGVNVLKMNLTT